MSASNYVTLAIDEETFLEKGQHLKEFLSQCDSIEITKKGARQKRAYYFMFEAVCWWPTIEGVKDIHKFIDDNNEMTGMVKIGEDWTDIETYGSYHDFDIYPYTIISKPDDNEVISIEDFLSTNSVKFIKELPDE